MDKNDWNTDLKINIFLDNISRGSFAVVHKAIKKDNNEEVAVKIFDK